MKYFKIGNKIYEENNVKNDSDLLLFGNMPKDAFLRRILKCYNIDLNYNIKDRQIMFKDLETDQFLDNKPNSPLWNSENLNIKLICEKGDLIVNIKRKPNIDVSLKVDLVSSIDWKKCNCNDYEIHNLDYNNDDLVEFKHSKYGDYEYKNNISGYSFKYNSETLKNQTAKPNTINIISFFNQNRLTYNLENGELSTLVCYSSKNKIIKNKEIVFLDNYKNLFTNDLETFKPIINDDISDLKQMISTSRLAYLKSLKHNLLKDIKSYNEQISILTKKIKETIEKINLIGEEMFNLIINDKFNFSNIIKGKNSYTKK